MGRTRRKISSFLQVVSDEIKPFLPENGEVLVAGLGNAAITPDALGEKVIAQILATRHVKKELERITGVSELRSVAAVSTDVLGNTGMETAEILKGLTQQLRPKAVIVIDAMAARSLERLGKTVQISTAGIAPGAGVLKSQTTNRSDTIGRSCDIHWSAYGSRCCNSCRGFTWRGACNR